MKETSQQPGAYTPEQILSTAQDIVLENINPPAGDNWLRAERRMRYEDRTNGRGDTLPYDSAELKLKDGPVDQFLHISILGEVVGYNQGNHVFNTTTTVLRFALKQRDLHGGYDSTIEDHIFSPTLEGVQKLDELRLRRLGHLLASAERVSSDSNETPTQFYPELREQAQQKRFVKEASLTDNSSEALA